MSFDVKKWLTDPATCSDMPLYLFEDENVTALVEAAVTASRAESEAQITALQLERDALMEAVGIYERLLCTPTSGEPARKP